MLQKSRIVITCTALMLVGLIPALSHGQEVPAPGVGVVSVQPEVCEQAPSSQTGLEQEKLTLEQIEKMVGRQNMCGVSCGFNDPTVTNCTFACGDAAYCFYGSCVYW